jgi:hypothetical protein
MSHNFAYLTASDLLRYQVLSAEVVSQNDDHRLLAADVDTYQYVSENTDIPIYLILASRRPSA